MEDKLKTLVEELLQKMQVVFTEVKVAKDEADYYHVDIQTPETGLLIGYHGEGIKSLDLMLRLMMYRQEGSQVKIVLNVGDYRQKREESLKMMADHMIARLKEFGDPVTFPALSAGERRVIHLYLQDNSEVETVSEGEGENRRIILKFKTTEK